VSLNVYVNKYSHPRRVNPHSSVVKRYATRNGKLVEISLTEKLAKRPAERASRIRK